MNKISFSINNIKEEKQIVEMTRKDVDFFKRHKIKITWPKNTTVEKEYNKERYQKELENIKKSWEKEKNNFLEKASDYFNQEIGEVMVKVSAYGPMGFYDAETNTVTINFNNSKPIQTIKHEIVHIMLEKTQKRGEIKHTKKENVVNNILSTIEKEN
ncbi:MAG: hypothetical protein ACQEP3_03050 [Patescibacteria group bacterium]